MDEDRVGGLWAGVLLAAVLGVAACVVVIDEEVGPPVRELGFGCKLEIDDAKAK